MPSFLMDGSLIIELETRRCHLIVIVAAFWGEFHFGTFEVASIQGVASFQGSRLEGVGSSLCCQIVFLYFAV